MKVPNNILSTLHLELYPQIIGKLDDFEALKNCEYVCKLWKEIVEAIKDYQLRKEAFFVKKLMPEIDLFPPELIDCFSGKKNIYKLPITPLNFIFSLTTKDLSGHLIWRGEDATRGTFIAFTCKVQTMMGGSVEPVFAIFRDSVDNNWKVYGCYRSIGDTYKIKSFPKLKDFFSQLRKENIILDIGYINKNLFQCDDYHSSM